MKNMKLGTRIAFGFGVLIVIAGILGTVGVWEMGPVETETTKLSQEYIPEVNMAVDLRGGRKSHDVCHAWLRLYRGPEIP